MKIMLATNKYRKQIINFFDDNLDKSNKAVCSDEFFCPFGTGAAVKRNQVVIGIDEGVMVSAVRFYPRKTDKIVSVYQFAVDKKYRGNKLLQQMLQATGFEKFEFKCPKEINFNNYYKKIGANIGKQDEDYNYWVLINKYDKGNII